MKSLHFKIGSRAVSILSTLCDNVVHVSGLANPNGVTDSEVQLEHTYRNLNTDFQLEGVSLLDRHIN